MIHVTRERVTRINLSPYLHYARGWTMRVWRDEPKDKVFEPNQTQPDPDVLARINSAVQFPMSQYDLALRVLELERVNAVEVTDTVGAGDVLYKDWP